jgi:hypothetical protein
MARVGGRRAFTLIEAVVIVVVLAIALPTTLNWLDEANQRRVDSVNATRATALATCVMEHILGDVSSRNASLGFAALANSSTYLNTATTGLVARLTTFTSPYNTMGFAYTVTIGALVDRTGVTTGVATSDLYRIITVSVNFTGADGTARTVTVKSMVTSL